MIEIPDEIWNYIKEFTFDWKRSHKQKMSILERQLNLTNEQKKAIYERWTYFPPWPNTNDIIRDEYIRYRRLLGAPRPNLELTSITWNIKGTGGWWCGYGWKKHPIFLKK